jgi:hypothetical protein
MSICETKEPEKISAAATIISRSRKLSVKNHGTNYRQRNSTSVQGECRIHISARELRVFQSGTVGFSLVRARIRRSDFAARMNHSEAVYTTRNIISAGDSDSCKNPWRAA